MKFRVGRAVAGTMAVAAATLMATAGPASADIPPGINWDHTWHAEGVTVYVEEHGDYVSVCDSKANGHAAYVRVTSKYQYIAKASGYGSCTTRNAGTGDSWNLSENRNVYVEYKGDGGSWHYHNFLNDH